MNEVPGHSEKESLAHKHQPNIHDGLRYSLTGVGAAITQAMRSAASTDAKDAIISAVNLAVMHNLKPDPSKLSAALSNLYEDAGKSMHIPLTKMGARLQSLLDNADATANGIVQTALGRVRTAIVDGVSSGQSYSQIADSINQVIADPARSSLIAITESNSAYNYASLDTYQQAGVSQWNWIAYEGACDDCLDGEAQNPHDMSDPVPPDASHPSCRCGVEAVTD